MARWKRYGEARAYVAAGTLALLLSIWAGLAMKDAAGRSESEASSGNTAAISSDSSPTRITPHSRTRAS